jgi:tRNA dimethylallyltransferase
MKPKIIVVLGPTASGKTSLSIKLAQEFSGEIISVDSRQIYREMNIGTAKEPEDKKIKNQENKKISSEAYYIQDIPHHGIDIRNPNEEMTAAEFKEYAEQKIEDIVTRGKVPILAGGTGFWIQAIIENLEIPAVPPDQTLRQVLGAKSAQELYKMYKDKDPVGAKTIDKHNKVRMIRAIEICIKTGTPMSDQQSKGEQKYNVLQIGIDVDRKELYNRIDQRVDQMIEQGLVNEVKQIRDKYGCVSMALTGIGYRQICEYIDDKVTLEQAIDTIKKDTRHYAKRQMSWFRRNKRIVWIKEYDQAKDLVKEFLV